MRTQTIINYLNGKLASESVIIKNTYHLTIILYSKDDPQCLKHIEIIINSILVY